MTKEEIFDKYAIKQGYDNLRDLLRYSDLDEIEEIIDTVTDLIQEEFKKKIAKNPFPEFLYENEGVVKIGYRGETDVSNEWLSYIKSILNTEIL